MDRNKHLPSSFFVGLCGFFAWLILRCVRLEKERTEKLVQKDTNVAEIVSKSQYWENHSMWRSRDHWLRKLFQVSMFLGNIFDFQAEVFVTKTFHHWICDINILIQSAFSTTNSMPISLSDKLSSIMLGNTRVECKNSIYFIICLISWHQFDYRNHQAM